MSTFQAPVSAEIPKRILCFGEVLWDSLPKGLFLGGAPFNVAYHLTSLGADASIASCIGDDTLGRIAWQRVKEKGLPVGLLQVESSAPTGLVNVKIDAFGNASYDIVAPAAWDFIRPESSLLELAENANAIVFGTLAQRAPTSRSTLYDLLKSAHKRALRVFDVNLRAPFDNVEIVRQGLQVAEVVKLNDQEFARIVRWFELPDSFREGSAALAQRFNTKTVCITRGGDGATLWNEGRYLEHCGFKVQVRDTVGAGDAFLASLLKGLLEHQPDDLILKRANAHGAFVATQDGATPHLNVNELRTMESSAKG